MPKSKVAVFKAGARAIRQVSQNGACNHHQKQDILRTRAVLRSYIVELATHDNGTLSHIENAMRDLHPKIEYDSDLMIRDLADVCRTLKRLTENKFRSKGGKILEAKQLCLSLMDELHIGSLQ